MLLSCFAHCSTNSKRCSMGDVSFQGTDPPQVRTVGVTHVLGPVCHPCARSVPVQGEEPWGDARMRRLPKNLCTALKLGDARRRRLPKKLVHACESQTVF